MQRTPESVILFACAKRPPLSGAADARRYTKMILDGIAALVGAIIEPIVMAAVYLVAGIANLFLVLVELVIGLFIRGYKTKRIKAKIWKERSSKLSGWSSLIVFAAIAIAVAVMELMDKEVQLVASDGHSLPYAEVLIITEKEERNERTDKTGKVEIPRFRLVSLSQASHRVYPPFRDLR